jgi:hypothetical protein
MKTILILKGPNEKEMVIDAIALRWIRAGHRVITHHGTEDLPEADVVVLHVDTTRVPDEYRRGIRAYPVVVNRGAVDVSKTRYGGHFLTEPDDDAGAVIVKTTANYGGGPDDRYHRNRSRMRRLRRRLVGKGTKTWERRSRLNPLDYPIFDSSREVPAGVWKNRNLLVQRFLPEMEGELFFIRYWMFFGDQGWARRFGSRTPIAKFHTRVTDEECIPVPDELVEIRDRLRVDYGRFDYVLHEGKPVVFDVNKTLSAGGDLDQFADDLDRLATGINGFLEQTGGGVVEG